jgi:N utilization substance protein B
MKNKKSRKKTRVYVLEVIYQWLHTQVDVSEVLKRYDSKYAVDTEYLESMVQGALSKRSDIDQQITPNLEDRALEEISQIEYAILLLGGYELMYQYDVPYKVVINEAINLAKNYGAQDAHKFVNSVLDRIAKDVRGIECQGQ